MVQLLVLQTKGIRSSNAGTEIVSYTSISSDFKTMTVMKED